MAAARSGGPHWGAAAKSCVAELGGVPGDANFGLVYVGEGFSDDLPSIVAYLREATGISDWLGAVGYGVWGPGEVPPDGRVMAILVGHFEPGAARPLVGFDPMNVDGFLSNHGEWLARQRSITALVHADPRHPKLGDAILGLAASAPAFLVGGLTAGSGQTTQLAGRAAEFPLSGALLGDGVPLAAGLTQGCTPIGPPHRITEASNNVLIGLDDEPALDVMKREAGDLIARDLQKAAGFIHVALPIEGSDTDDYLVRNLIAIDANRGWLAVGQTLEVGDRLMFVRRDANAARKDMTRMLDGLVRRLDGRAIRGGIYVSCVGRGANMFGEAGVEAMMIHQALGDFPMIGFSAAGEICHDRLYTYTGVLTLFL